MEQEYTETGTQWDWCIMGKSIHMDWDKRARHTMGLGHSGTGTVWDWYAMGKSIHMDWDKLMGQAYTGTGTQWGWYTMELDSVALGYIATTPLPSLD